MVRNVDTYYALVVITLLRWIANRIGIFHAGEEVIWKILMEELVKVQVTGHHSVNSIAIGENKILPLLVILDIVKISVDAIDFNIVLFE